MWTPNTWPLIRRHTTAIAVMLLGMAIFWGVLWIIAAAQYRTVIDNWIAAEKAHGNVVRYADRAIGGFPQSITIHFTGFYWQNQSGAKAEAGNLTLAAHPWNWRVFNLNFKDNAKLTMPYPDNVDTLTISGEFGDGHAELTEENDWHVARVRFRNVHATRPSREVFIAEELTLAAQQPDTPPTNPKEMGIGLMAQASSVQMKPQQPLPFGDKVAELDVVLRAMGPLPDFSNRESVNTWSNNGGIVEFEKFNMEWGPLSLMAKGSLGFDDDLQAEGAFFGQIGGHEEVIKDLLDHEWIAKRQASMLDSALNLFAKPSKITNKPSIDIPITVQLGGLFLGPVRIFAFPDIVWAQAKQQESKPIETTAP